MGTATPVSYLAIRHHPMKLSYRLIKAFLHWVGADRCHQAVWNWKEAFAAMQNNLPVVKKSWIAGYQRQIRVDDDKNTLLSTRSQRCPWKSISTVAAARLPRRRSSTASRRNMTCLTPSFSSMLMGP